MDEQKDFHDSKVINAPRINNDFDKADEIDHTFPGDDLLDPAHVDIEVPESKLHKIPNELVIVNTNLKSLIRFAHFNHPI